tara:strand:+ start:2407 stop:2517 length:111 start_codon:yes stop_codon:yes gene_type:complete
MFLPGSGTFGLSVRLEKNRLDLKNSVYLAVLDDFYE